MDDDLSLHVELPENAVRELPASDEFSEFRQFTEMLSRARIGFGISHVPDHRVNVQVECCGQHKESDDSHIVAWSFDSNGALISVNQCE